MRRSTAWLGVALVLVLPLFVSSVARADATDGTLFYTVFSGAPNVKSVDFTYDGVATFTLAAPVAIGTTNGADGIAGNPQDPDLLLIGGQGPRVNTISISTGTAIEYASPVNAFHLEVSDASTLYAAGIPGAIAEHTLLGDGSVGAGTTITVSGDDTLITQLITTPASGFFYTSSGGGGTGSYGEFTFTGATTATTTRFHTALPAAHGGTYDPFSDTVIIMGDSHITQIDLAGAIVADLDFTGQGLQFDQGTVDGDGHLFAADNNGSLLFLDYSGAAGGLIDDGGNFIDVQFLDNFLDDVAPLVGAGATNPPTCSGPTGTVIVEVGENYQAIVTGDDPDGDDLTVTAVTLPPGSSINPVSGSVGASPFAVTFSWTPTNGDIGVHNVVITFTDPTDAVATCAWSIEVVEAPECFLVVSNTPGTQQFAAGEHLFETQVGQINNWWPVLVEDIPLLPVNVAFPDLQSPTGRVPSPFGFKSPITPLRTRFFQVLMWNPEVFPENPEQYTHGLRVDLWPNGSITGWSYGHNDGMHMQLETIVNEEGVFFRLPFVIDGF